VALNVIKGLILISYRYKNDEFLRFDYHKRKNTQKGIVMTYKIIQNLVEDLSLEFVLSDSSEPESLSVLLPILENIKEEVKTIPEPENSNELLKMQKCILENIESETKTAEEAFEIIDETISKMKTFLHALECGDSNKVDVEGQTDTMGKDQFEKIASTIEEFSNLISGFCPDEIVDLGAMITILDKLIEQASKCDSKILSKVAGACKHYIENMTLEQLYDTKPIEEALVLLRAVQRHLKKGSPFIFETKDIFEKLEVSAAKQAKEKATQISVQTTDSNESVTDERSVIGEEKEELQTQPDIQVDTEPDQVDTELGQVEKVSEDDMEILVDFISEAEENLDSIEVNLIELEQDPTNKDIINEIFRPFHTIKGVSGFLALKKINTLAHTTENLLDSARSGDFIINDVATDAVLESVDMLKKLISRVKTGIEHGLKQQDSDILIDVLRDKLQNLQISLTKGEPLGEILVKKGIVDKETLDKALLTQQDHPDKKIGEILVEESETSPKEVAAALMDQKTPKKKLTAQVKVSTDKLDDLVDYAGELVIAQSMLRQRTAGDINLTQSVTQLGQIVTHMQNIAMSMRMIPIKATFMKMIRLVRDLSHKSGKDVSLNMTGEDTEIDRNVVDALYEPMVHMIRNSVDHGIEDKAGRQANGKPLKGNVDLRAYHKGGNIIIEIEDDGKGLDKDRILEKAKTVGLITGDEKLTDAQIYDFIMHPGFSTAKEITDVSGRGVGMDVVKNGIEKFRGFLGIESTKGKGTRFTISLPLTLAIIDGMLVRVGDEKYVIPTIAIQRAFKPNKEDCFTIEGKGEMLKERDQLIPLIRIKDIFGDQNDTSDIWESLVIVVESKEEQRGLLVDELLGKDEYVIKSLGTNLENVEGLAGGAILADGRVGLILDIHGVFSIVSH
jgi:two-component system chemotaxis sensor kinase CheA